MHHWERTPNRAGMSAVSYSLPPTFYPPYGAQHVRFYPLWSVSEVWHPHPAAGNAWPSPADMARNVPGSFEHARPPAHAHQPSSYTSRSQPVWEPLPNADEDASRVHKLRDAWLARMHPESAPQLEPRVERWLLDYIENMCGHSAHPPPQAPKKKLLAASQPSAALRRYVPLLLPESDIWNVDAPEGSWPGAA
ncbi:hypothetical protein C8Q76DRAFT_716151 [Earliella scabrosa]|nr:hypothetical protein C8Q76DRAFT_716151 [Earliella scabrosa]